MPTGRWTQGHGSCDASETGLTRPDGGLTGSLRDPSARASVAGDLTGVGATSGSAADQCAEGVGVVERLRIDRSAVQHSERRAVRRALARQPQDMSETEYDERSFAPTLGGLSLRLQRLGRRVRHINGDRSKWSSHVPKRAQSEERCAGRVGGRHGARCQSPQAEGRRADRNRSVVEAGAACWRSDPVGVRCSVACARSQ